MPNKSLTLYSHVNPANPTFCARLTPSYFLFFFVRKLPQKTKNAQKTPKKPPKKPPEMKNIAPTAEIDIKTEELNLYSSTYSILLPNHHFYSLPPQPQGDGNGVFEKVIFYHFNAYSPEHTRCFLVPITNID